MSCCSWRNCNSSAHVCLWRGSQVFLEVLIPVLSGLPLTCFFIFPLKKWRKPNRWIQLRPFPFGEKTQTLDTKKVRNKRTQRQPQDPCVGLSVFRRRRRMNWCLWSRKNRKRRGHRSDQGNLAVCLRGFCGRYDGGKSQFSYILVLF